LFKERKVIFAFALVSHDLFGCYRALVIMSSSVL